MGNNVCGIYKITSPTGKIYIGQSKDIRKRWYHYKTDTPYTKTSYKLYRSLIKYGWEKHNFEVIHECTEMELDYFEIHYINFFNSFNTAHGMNLREGGKRRFNISECTRKKISKSNTGKKHSKESIAKRAAKMLGMKHTEEAKNKIREKALGRKCSDDTKVKMSEAGKRRVYAPFSEEHKNKIRNYKRINSGKRIIQFDLNGKYIKTWYCMNDIEKELGIDIASIIRVCKGKQKTSIGFKWEYENEKDKPLESDLKKGRLGALNNNSIKISQYDINNNFIREWISAAVAARELMINASNISAVCKGKDKTYKGFIWKYSTQ